MWTGTVSGLNAVLQKFGLQLNRFPSRADRRRIQLMRRRSITTVIDIGANEGQYVKLLRKLGYADSVISFEPLPAAFKRLSAAADADERWSARQQAVGENSGQVTMHIAGNSVSSSILEMGSRHVDAAPESRTIASVSVPCVTLREILSSVSDKSLMVKIDTQGFEKSVLKGGADMLSKVALFEIELSFTELYRGQALFWEIDALMMASGCKIVSLEEGFFDEASGELLQCDAIYARVNS